MRHGHRVSVIIPALNEEASLGKVLDAVPDWADQAIVADNGSTDGTPAVAARHGAEVVYEPVRGYGAACLRAMDHLDSPDVVVFLDGDYSDYPEEMHLLVDPVIRKDADMVIGSRVLGRREPGALTPQARFGNWLSCRLMRLLWGVTFTDLGPFRAIRYKTLLKLDMQDPNYGWTVEMQIKAARDGVPSVEVPVSYRKRIGKSKVSGTVRGVFGAGTKILYTIGAAGLDSLLDRHRRRKPRRLILFTRYPEAGLVKTRLIPALGPEGAAMLHQQLTEHIIGRLIPVIGRRSVITEIRFSGGDARQMAEWLGSQFRYTPQEGGDLGRKMHTALADALAGGAKRAVLVGTDIPGLTGTIVEHAFAVLRDRDLVFGPAVDGGYYLVGACRLHPALFSDIPWSTSAVLKKTLEKVEASGLTYGLTERLDDVDRPEDVDSWSQEHGVPNPQDHAPDRRVLSQHAPEISVIVPTLNEIQHIEETITTVIRCEDAEAIVVDGGSSDRTVDAARAAGAEVLTGETGRALQMNLGARHARGRTLLFLHADTRLPEDWPRLIDETLTQPGTAAGAFELRLDDDLPGLRCIERLANVRSRYLQLPYGDQGLFMRAGIFRSVGCFPELPVMEDLELVRRLKKLGQVSLVPAPATSSARRWKKLGVLRTTLTHQLLIVLYYLGASPTLLARILRRGTVRK